MSKYNRFYLGMISIFVVISFVCVSSHAANQNEFDEIENILNSEENFLIIESNGTTINENYYDNYNLDGAKKTYFSDTLMLTAYEEAKTVDSIVSEKYQWCVPFGEEEQNVAIFSISDGEMILSGTRSSKGYYLSDDEISKILAEANFESTKTSSIKRVFSPMYYTVFNIIETESATFCIPFSSNTEFIGLENKKLYEFEDMMRILIERFDESKLLESPDSNGGVPFRENNYLWVSVVIVVSFASIIICSILLINNKKKKELETVLETVTEEADTTE